KKTTPAARDPPLRCGHPAVLTLGGVCANSPSAQTCAALHPPRPALLGSRRRGFSGRCTRSRGGESDPALPCGRAEQRSGVGIRNSHVRRPRSGQVCEFPPRREQRKEPRSGPDFGSPFFCLLFLGETKKRRSPAGARPGQTKPQDKPETGEQQLRAPEGRDAECEA